MAKKVKAPKSAAGESAAEVAARLEAPPARPPAIPDTDLLSMGSALLNIAVSGRPGGGIPVGTYLYLVGDSGSAKTWSGFTLFAEAARNPRFKHHRFVFDNAENGALMDVERYFGASAAARLEAPRLDAAGDPMYSSTVQDFYFNLERNCTAGPCIYFLDSMDAINDAADETQFAAALAADDGDDVKVPGSMGMAKAKTNSKNINRVARALRQTDSILVVISQTRDKIGAQFPTKTRGGGNALKFYAHVEIWTSVRAPITRTYLRKEREVGDVLRFDVRKNRVSGWEGKLDLPFLKGYGLDDVGSCIDYLIEERHWSAPGKKSKKDADRKAARSDDEDETDGKSVCAPEFDFSGKKETLVKLIQDADEEWKLHRLVAQVWRDIAAGAAPVRKPRY